MVYLQIDAKKRKAIGNKATVGGRKVSD